MDPETLSAMLDLINFFVETEVPQISSLYPQLITLALKWIQESTASYRALSLLKNLVLSADKNDDNILEPLMAGQKVFLLIFNSALDENVMDQSEHVKRLVESGGFSWYCLTGGVQVRCDAAIANCDDPDEGCRSKTCSGITSGCGKASFPAIVG